MATLTKKNLLEAIEDMPMDASIDEVFSHLILNKRLEFDFRAEQMITVLKNRKRYALLKSNKSEAKIYDDCLAILNKEFFELALPHDIRHHARIREIRDKIIEKICPVDDRIRGTRLHGIEMKKANEIAGIIEGLCYEMFNHGCRYIEEQAFQTEK